MPTRNGKTKARRKWKEPPSQGLSPNDHRILKKMTRKAWRLDMAFSVCFCCHSGDIRLGWSAVIGILPVIGDIINLYLSLSLLKLAQKVDDGLPAFTVSKMMSNVMIDFVLGITPVLGTIAGALYKANSRNALILEHFLKKRAKENIKKGLYVVDPSTGRKKKSWFTWGKSTVEEDNELIMANNNQPVTSAAGREYAIQSTPPVTAASSNQKLASSRVPAPKPATTQSGTIPNMPARNPVTSPSTTDQVSGTYDSI